jgi:hypothetical protein
MNLSMFKPLQKGILPFRRLDGSPQTLEGTPRSGEEAVYAGFDLERA